MDLSKVVINNTAPCHIVAPDGKKTDIVIEMYGVDSKERQVALKNYVLAMQEGEKKTDDESAALSVALLSDCIATWSNISDKGKDLKPTKTNKTKVITDHKWIKEQIDKFASSRVNFLEKA